MLGQRLRSIFGPRIEFLGSGGAPLPVAVARAFENAGLLLLQGYGLTESSPVISFNRRDHNKIETVGQPPGVEVRIGPDDEILVRPARRSQLLEESQGNREHDRQRLAAHRRSGPT